MPPHVYTFNLSSIMWKLARAQRRRRDEQQQGTAFSFVFYPRIQGGGDLEVTHPTHVTME